LQTPKKIRQEKTAAKYPLDSYQNTSDPGFNQFLGYLIAYLSHYSDAPVTPALRAERNICLNNFAKKLLLCEPRWNEKMDNLFSIISFTIRLDMIVFQHLERITKLLDRENSFGLSPSPFAIAPKVECMYVISIQSVKDLVVFIAPNFRTVNGRNHR